MSDGNIPFDVICFWTLVSNGAGSDHDALTATVTLGPVEAARVEAAVEAVDFLKAQPPGNEWQHFWCGQLETDVGYAPRLDPVAGV